MTYYILVGQTPVPCDVHEWAQWLEHNQEARRVNNTTLLGLVQVSTVFLGLDHGWGMSPRPVLFETMAFWDGESGDEQERCCTWREAEKQHEAMVREVMRPARVGAYALRALAGWWRAATRDWRREWDRLRGIEPDPLWASWKAPL